MCKQEEDSPEVNVLQHCLWEHCILSKIWGFQGGDYEEWCLLGRYAVWLL
jgi:hypothetical protein